MAFQRCANGKRSAEFAQITMSAIAKSIFLVGLPGSGKTTTGKLLSSRIGMSFIDLDEVIVKSEGKAINKIFEENGEDYFRKKESACLDVLLHSNSPQIISTGGGTPCFFDNADRMNKAGVTIYLSTPWSVLATRVAPEQSIRPLFNGLGDGDIEQRLIERFSWRLPFYRQSLVTVETKGKNVEAIVEEIASQL